MCQFEEKICSICKGVKSIAECGWHIDHIIPCDYFNLVNIEQQRICFHYLNLQPLWEVENIKKNNNVPENKDELINLIKSVIDVQNS